MHLARRTPLPGLPWAVAALAVAACGALTRIGADSRWLAALGGVIARTQHVPSGVPYATATSGAWHNVPVLGELIFYGLEHGLGDHGLILAQVAAVAVALAAIARDAPAGGGIVLLLVPVAALDSFVVVRSQLFSLALFPLLALLLRRESRTPSRRIWLLVPLVALWSNLHGAVLVGLAVAGVYLLLERLRTEPGVALGVLAASGAAGLATPAGLGTIAYYRGVLGNAWVSSHQGYWAPPSPRDPLDVLFALSALALVLLAIGGRPRLWEYVAGAGLAVSAATAARNEVWLVLFVAPLAMRGLRRARTPRPPVRLALALVPLAAAAMVTALAWASPSRSELGASARLRAQAIAAAGETPILADPYDAEQLALAGAKVVIGNPIDAFPLREQLLYMHWLQGEGVAASSLAPASHVVLVSRTLAASRRLARDPSFCRRAADRLAVLYVRCRRPAAR